jgi:hypothetical protein
MPIPVLIWIVAAALAGTAVGYFWEDVIRPWAIRAAENILDSIDLSLKSFTKGVTSLTTKGRKYLKNLTVYTRDKRTGVVGAITTTQELSDDEINKLPNDIREELGLNNKIEGPQIKT